MLWIVVILVVLGLIGAISAASDQSKENAKKAELNETTKVRVAAYAEYLKRTSTNSQITAMTEVELHDLLHTTIRDYKKQADGAAALGALIVGAGLLLGIIVGVSEKSWGGFVVISALSFAFASFVLKKRTAVIDQSFTTQGFDVARLKVSED